MTQCGPLADREWRFVAEETRPGPMQMALDEVAAETAAAGGPRTVRVYRWEPSTLSLGYGQDPDTVDWDACDRRGVDVTRRQTGGGGILHHVDGDISYSIAAPRDELPGNLLDAYHLLCTPVLDALGRMGVDAGFAADERPGVFDPACYLRPLHPAHDIVAGGRKISGNAQYRRQDAVVQHGSLTYEVNAVEHLDVFAGHDVSPEAFCERVTGIREEAGIDRATAVDALESSLSAWTDATPGAWTGDELARARERASEKYASDEWIRRRPGER